jgi:toxin ParE1/3/4
VESLQFQIKMGKVVSEYEDPQVLEIQEGNYRIIYTVKTDNELDIVLIHHGARRLPRIKK